MILRYLELEGVDHLFGIPGGALMHFCDELKKQDDRFTYVICRQETGAGYMADGYARIKGGLGVVTVTAGPGATNALTAAMNAQASGTSMLVITGEVPEQYFGLGYLQEGIDSTLNVDEIYHHAVGSSNVITNASNAQTLLSEALRGALSAPGQVAHLSLPDDVAGHELLHVVPGEKEPVPCSEEHPCTFPSDPSAYRAVPRGFNPEEVKRAFELLTSAKKPLIFLGNGTRRAMQGEGFQHLLNLVEKFGIPVMTTPEAKALFPESHPMSLRNWGIGYCEWPQFYMGPPGEGHFDALLILASGLGELATVKWNPMVIPDGSVIQVDLSQAAIGRAYPLTLGIVAEVGQVLEELSRLADGASPDPKAVENREQLVEWIKVEHSPYRDPEKRDSAATPILPQALMKCIDELLPDRTHIFVDSGNCFGWAAHYLSVDPPSTFNIALNMGPMGVAVGAVVGGKLAAPDHTCVAIVGDGAFMMQGSEVSTAARYGIGAIWIVLNDDDLAMVSQGMNQFFPKSKPWKHYYDLGTPDLAMYARGLGADAYDVHSPEDMRKVVPRAIEAAGKGKPQVIVAHIDRNEVPPYYQKPQVG
jgi:acetolactate synthase-1/2/3 large subunit